MSKLRENVRKLWFYKKIEWKNFQQESSQQYFKTRHQIFEVFFSNTNPWIFLLLVYGWVGNWTNLLFPNVLFVKRFSPKCIGIATFRHVGWWRAEVGSGGRALWSEMVFPKFFGAPILSPTAMEMLLEIQKTQRKVTAYISHCFAKFRSTYYVCLWCNLWKNSFEKILMNCTGK